MSFLPWEFVVLGRRTVPHLQPGLEIRVRKITYGVLAAINLAMGQVVGEGISKIKSLMT